MKTLITICLAIMMIAGCTITEESNIVVDSESESIKVNTFFDRVFDEYIDRHPEHQTYLGIKKDYDKWEDLSDDVEKKELEITKQNLQWLNDSVNFDALDKQTKVSYQMFKAEAERDISNFKYRMYDYPVNQMFGTHSEVPSFLINMHLVTDESDARAYISRLQKVDVLFDQLIVNLEDREEIGIVPPKFVFPRVIDDSKNVITGLPFSEGDSSALFSDFGRKVAALDIASELKQSLLLEGEKALVEVVRPAYEKLIVFLEAQHERANMDDGVWKFKDGDAFYNEALKRTTTTELTAEEIHNIGLKEVARIHEEVRIIMKQTGFEGDLQAFFEFMRTDDQFYYPNDGKSKQLYLDSAVAVIDYMRTRLDELFLTKPKAALKVKKVEAFREKSAGKAFYNRPAPDGSRPGIYYANLYNMKNMPFFEMEALAYHEGIPGHHMQLAIAQELEGLPKFRKFGGYTAYIEGWGLYCEFLPKEIGLYANPYSDYGRLAMELWRACRLVVDTGIHLKKWTREEGIEYYSTNTSGSPRECERMVERHIVMASQATAYKIGMLKILEVREKAKTALGDKFDIRKFHDVVLTNGAVPLDVLEDLVDEYIAKEKSI